MNRSPVREKKVGVSSLSQKKLSFSRRSLMAIYTAVAKGPSKFDVSVSLFDSEGGHCRPVTFTLQNLRIKDGVRPKLRDLAEHGHIIRDLSQTNELERAYPSYDSGPIVINSAKCLNKNGEMWCLSGRLSNEDEQVTVIYSFKTREGWFLKK